MENKEVRRGHNHNQLKRKIAAGHVVVVNYMSSRILAKVSCSLALPSCVRTLCDCSSAPHKYCQE